MMIEVPIEQVPADIHPELGMVLQLQGGNGQPMPVTVVAIDEAKITLDANHELAGKDLIFEIELVTIR